MTMVEIAAFLFVTWAGILAAYAAAIVAGTAIETFVRRLRRR